MKSTILLLLVSLSLAMVGAAPALGAEGLSAQLNSYGGDTQHAQQCRDRGLPRG